MTYSGDMHPTVVNLMKQHNLDPVITHDNLDPAVCICHRSQVVSRPGGLAFEGETCPQCGGLTVRTGSCRTCTECGANTGCG